MKIVLRTSYHLIHGVLLVMNCSIFVAYCSAWTWILIPTLNLDKFSACWNSFWSDLWYERHKNKVFLCERKRHIAHPIATTRSAALSTGGCPHPIPMGVPHTDLAGVPPGLDGGTPSVRTGCLPRKGQDMGPGTGVKMTMPKDDRPPWRHFLRRVLLIS